MMKGLVNSVSNLADLLDGAGATQEVTDVREEVNCRSRFGCQQAVSMVTD